MDSARDGSSDAAQRRRADGKRRGEDAPLMAGRDSDDHRRLDSEQSEETPLLTTLSEDEEENEYLKPVNYNEWHHLPWWKRPSVCPVAIPPVHYT
jgi:hypothetical protein